MSNKQNKTQGFNCCFPKNISRREEKKNKKMSEEFTLVLRKNYLSTEENRYNRREQFFQP